FNIPIEAKNITINDIIAEYLGVILSVSQPNNGLPIPLNTANTETAIAAVAGVNLIISCPTGLEIAIAMSPLNVPIM
ncbi:unnamed protein product, partial [marine sediment metagenome]